MTTTYDHLSGYMWHFWWHLLSLALHRRLKIRNELLELPAEEEPFSLVVARRELGMKLPFKLEVARKAEQKLAFARRCGKERFHAFGWVGGISDLDEVAASENVDIALRQSRAAWQAAGRFPQDHTAERRERHYVSPRGALDLQRFLKVCGAGEAGISLPIDPKVVAVKFASVSLIDRHKYLLRIVLAGLNYRRKYNKHKQIDGAA
jgi:hypothetical protein